MSAENQGNNPYSLLVVIVNYRTATLTIDCLKSLVTEIESLKATKVVVVDNDSGDNSVPEIENAIASHGWSQWASLIAGERNGGFAYGNNIAIREALKSNEPPTYILLLNPDTVVRHQGLQLLVKFMEENPKVGIAGSRLEDPDGTAQASAFRFHTMISEFMAGLRLGIVSKLLSKWEIAPNISDVNCQTDWVAGASMIIRREVFDGVGLMDEDYFMYYEEVDFCLQANRAGWTCWYVPESHVVHLVGQSSGVTNTKVKPKRRPQYWFESRRRYFLKNHGWLYAVLADFLWIIGFCFWKLRQIIQRKPDNYPPYFLEDFWKNSTLLNLKIFNPPMTTEAEVRESTDKSETSEIGLWAQIKEDWIAHGRDWTRPGFRAVAVQRFGVWRMKIQPKLLRAPLSIIYWALYRKVRNTYGIELLYTVKLGRRVIIEHQHGIVIHGGCSIGDDCIIRQGVTLGNRYLDRPHDAPQLGVKVNVGAGAKVLGGVNIGDHVNIGANAVVLADILPGQTVVGIPAKVIKSQQT